MIFTPSSDSNLHTNHYLYRYELESKFFFFKKYFTKKKHGIKLTGKSTLYVFDNVRNDYFINMKFGLKTFFNVRSGIVNAIVKEKTKFPITTISLAKKKFHDLSIIQKNLTYLSNQEIRLRNLSVFIKPLQTKILIINPALITKSLTKLFYFNLILQKKINFLSSYGLILHRFRKNNWIQFINLGFIFKIKNKFLHKKNFFFKVKKANLPILKIKRRKKKSIFKFKRYGRSRKRLFRLKKKKFSLLYQNLIITDVSTKFTKKFKRKLRKTRKKWSYAFKFPFPRFLKKKKQKKKLIRITLKKKKIKINNLKKVIRKKKYVLKSKKIKINKFVSTKIKRSFVKKKRKIKKRISGTKLLIKILNKKKIHRR